MVRSRARTTSSISTCGRVMAALVLSGLGSVHRVAQAYDPLETSLTWRLSAENMVTREFNYLYSPDGDTSFSTGGLRTINSGAVTSSVNAWADPESGVFKALTSVSTGDTGRATSIAESTAIFNMKDALRISGPEATATLTLRLNYDTELRGLELSPFPRVEQLSHYLMADSSRFVALSYQAPNPLYDPEAQCLGEGESTVCGVETIEFNNVREVAGAGFFREWSLGGPNGVYSNGDAVDGRYTGEVVLTVVVPTEVDMMLTYQGFHSVTCFHLNNCSVSVNSMFSDYIGLEVQDGYTFTSASGFRYEGIAAAVPEPSTWALMLAGLGLLGAARWRRQG